LFNLPKALCYTEELNEFVFQFLKLNPLERATAAEMLSQPFLNAMSCIPDKNRANSSFFDNSCSTPAQNHVNSSSCDTFGSPISPRLLGTVKKNSLNLQIDPLMGSYSDRERKMLEDYNSHSHNGSHDHNLHLPPIEPMTPSINNARKILQKGTKLAKQFDHGIATPEGSPQSTSNMHSFLPVLSEHDHADT
jgi:hypothetical protein